MRPAGELIPAFARAMPYAVVESVPIDSGGRRSVITVKCDCCDAVVDWSIAKGAMPPPEAVAQKARAKGWSVRKKGATCPDCQKVSSVAEKLDNRPSETPPREPSKADKRAIFRKLDEVYDDRSEIYCEGYSDEIVARELGMPRNWIEEIRAEHFGPAGNPELLRAVTRLGQMHDTVTEMMNTLMEGAAACERKLAEIDTERKQIHTLMQKEARK